MCLYHIGITRLKPTVLSVSMIGSNTSDYFLDFLLIQSMYGATRTEPPDGRWCTSESDGVVG